MLHVIKILDGRVIREEREWNGLYIYSPATHTKREAKAGMQPM
jgi:hypothetical protein